MITPYIERIQSGQSLSVSEAEACLLHIFNHSIPDSDIVTLLQALSAKGEAVSELVGFSRAMRGSMLAVDLGPDVMDVCGTGGSGKDRFNVSTAAAFVLASLGVRVAKHGNRGSRQANGSFDFLEALDINFTSIERSKACFDRFNLCFLFARQHHPAVAKVAAARKQLGGRSIFNLIGPLCNPASVDYQIIGATHPGTAEKLASAIAQLGIKRAYVIVGGNGSDELSISAPSRLIQVERLSVMEPYEFYPEPLLGRIPASSETGGLAADNAALFQDILRHRDSNHAISKWISLNAGLAMHCANRAETISEGFDRAQYAIQSGQVYDVMIGIRDFLKGGH